MAGLTQLEKFKQQLEIKNDAKDGILELLLDNALDFILTYTNRDTLPVHLESLQRQIAVIYYNRLGLEGEQGRSEGGISSTIYVLNDDLPSSVKAQLNNHRLLKATRYAAKTT